MDSEKISKYLFGALVLSLIFCVSGYIIYKAYAGIELNTVDGVVSLIVGALISWGSNIVSFFFGSSTTDNEVKTMKDRISGMEKK
jgi:hypothetical protein